MSKQKFNKAILLFLLLLISLFIFKKSYAQDYSFSEIKEILLSERPQTGDVSLREKCFASIDDIILGTYPPLHPDTKGFFRFMLEKAIAEIKNEVVTEGATIWQIYNHGFVVKTASKTFGFDLYDYFDTEDFVALADLIDVYFISHRHGDHYSDRLISAMNFMGKPVVGPVEFNKVSIGMNADDSLLIGDLMVIAHDGLHSAPVRQFKVITPEGLKFLHTGDNQDTSTLPAVENIDVFLLNSWVNDSGTKSYVETIPIAINKIKPKVTLPGHILELGHLGTGHTPILYHEVGGVDDGNLSSDYNVLGWGERYHFENSSNDSIKPNIVENLSYDIQAETIVVSWQLPQPAADGDAASFYRIIVNDSEDFIINERNFYQQWDSLTTYNFKVYAYDACGNQSENYAETNATISDSYLRMLPRETIAEIGKACSVNVVIDNVSNLGNFQFDLIYDTEIVFAENVVMGDFLGSSGRNVSVVGPEIDNTGATGKLTFGGATSGTEPGANGSGVLATVIFNTQTSGSTTLDLQNVQVNDINGQPLSIKSPISGEIVVSPPQMWTFQSSGFGDRLNCVTAVSDLVAWAIGENGAVLFTTDGGKFWSDVWNDDNLTFSNVEALDNNTAFIAGISGKWSQGTNVSHIYRTNDAGVSWTEVFEQAGGFINDVTMFNQTEGVAIGGQMDGIWTILKTTDGGTSWAQIADAPQANEGEHPFFTSIFWLNESIGWFGTTDSRAFHTTDGGTSWEIVEIPPLQSVVSITFDKSGVGLAASNQAMVRTPDNGDYWQSMMPAEFGSIQQVLHYQNILWAVISKSIYKSTDNGSNWEWQITAENNLRFSSFVTNQRGSFGWCVGDNGTIINYRNENTQVNENKKVEIPEQFSLQQNYPNPFNSETTIQYSLSEDANVTIKVFNTLGQLVISLDQGFETSGGHQLIWDGKDSLKQQVPSGIYYYQITVNEFVDAKKMILLK